jgi:flavin reductase (DIM6/NTAB) family NADH-FMN oxidoreductase RutF
MKAMQAAELRHAAGHFATGVAVITTRDENGEFYGLTMNAVTCLSLEPPLFLICVDNKSDTLPVLLESRVFAINILAHDQETLSRVFASKGKDKFEGIGYHIGETGAPLLNDTLAAIECRISETYPGGDHVVILGRVERIEVNDKSEPLLFYRGGYAELLP